MRKTIAVIVGLSFLVITIIPLSEASRYTYHAYLSSKKGHDRKARYFSKRTSPFNYHRKTKRRKYSEPENYWTNQSSRRHKPYFSKYQKFYVKRPLIKKQKNELLPNPRFRTFSPYKYIIQTPYGYNRHADGIYRHKKSSLTFRVLKTPEKYKCVQESFNLCAINLGKDFKRKQNISHISHYTKSSRQVASQTRSFIKYPTFIESFRATMFGTENIYLILSTINPNDRSVIRIEAIANKKEAAYAAKTMFKVFESFRFKK